VIGNIVDEALAKTIESRTPHKELGTCGDDNKLPRLDNNVLKPAFESFLSPRLQTYLFAGIAITSVHIITVPETRDTLDIETMATRLEDHGSLDLNGLLTTHFYGQRFILVESAEMVVQRSGISGNIINCC
jgi:hypothetical protein